MGAGAWLLAGALIAGAVAVGAAAQAGQGQAGVTPVARQGCVGCRQGTVTSDGGPGSFQ